MDRGAGPEQFKTEHLHGVWPAIPLPWRDDDSLDAGLLREIVLRYKPQGSPASTRRAPTAS